MALTSTMVRRESYDTAQEFLHATDPSLHRFPRPVAKIAGFWGLQVVEAPKDICLDHGMIVGDKIVIARHRKPWEQRLTIAHELGHWVLGQGCDVTEAECTTFGSALLMPADDVKAMNRFLLGDGPHSPTELACLEREHETMSMLVRHYGTGYKAFLWAMADYGLIAGVPEWRGAEYIDSVLSEYFDVWHEVSSSDCQAKGATPATGGKGGAAERSVPCRKESGGGNSVCR